MDLTQFVKSTILKKIKVISIKHTRLASFDYLLIPSVIVLGAFTLSAILVVRGINKESPQSISLNSANKPSTATSTSQPTSISTPSKASSQTTTNIATSNPSSSKTSTQTTTTTNNETPSPTSTTNSSTNSTPATPNSLTPNNLFNLSDFNLTLPVDSTGGNGGTTCPGENAAQVISTTQLLNGFSDPYFELNSSNDLVFTAPSNGATTTPCEGSNHTRSELHEYYTGPNAATNGCWLSSLGGTLQATAVINSVSADSDEATIGQIHGNGSAAFVLLIYRPALKEILLNVYSDTTETTHSETVIQSNVTLGQTINYSLSFINGTIGATVNGNSISLTAGSAWDTYPVRFALGAYSAAPNSGNPAGDQTQVAFSSFAISH